MQLKHLSRERAARPDQVSPANNHTATSVQLQASGLRWQQAGRVRVTSLFARALRVFYPERSIDAG
jgi:hypothetical protein|eukprot:7378637-Prymnesium_polylepis.1